MRRVHRRSRGALGLEAARVSQSNESRSSKETLTLDVGGDGSLLQAPAHRFRTADEPVIARLARNAAGKAGKGSHAHESVGEE